MKDHSELTLRRQSDFNRVYNRGKSVGSKFVVVLFNKNNLDYSRTAFVASKKVGNSVCRNRARRLMKAAYHNIQTKLASGYDIVFVARAGIAETNEVEVEKSIFGAVKAAGLFN